MDRRGEPSVDLLKSLPQGPDGRVGFLAKVAQAGAGLGIYARMR